MKEKRILGVVLAAGRGSRMAPFTDVTPKPLAVIAGKTLLDYNLEPLVEFVDEFVIVTHWLEDQIRDYIGSSYQGVPVTYVHQGNPKGGTLNAYSTALKEISSDYTGYVVTNADNILGDGLFDVFFEGITSHPDHVYAVAQTFEDKEKLSSFGVFRVNDASQFIEIVEKPKEFVSDKVNAGVYYFPAEANTHIDGIITPEGREEYIIDILNAVKDHIPVQVVSADSMFLPVSTIADIENAQNILKITDQA